MSISLEDQKDYENVLEKMIKKFRINRSIALDLTYYKTRDETYKLLEQRGLLE